MRKLAPFVFTTIASLIGGTAFATTSTTTTTGKDVPSTDGPSAATVPANTPSRHGLSYSDKSSTSPGTNAKMDDKNAMSTTDPIVEKRNEKRKKAKVAKADPGMMKNSPMNTSPMNNMPMNTKPMATTPIDTSTNAAAANSTTGASGGR